MVKKTFVRSVIVGQAKPRFVLFSQEGDGRRRDDLAKSQSIEVVLICRYLWQTDTADESGTH